MHTASLSRVLTDEVTVTRKTRCNQPADALYSSIVPAVKLNHIQDELERSAELSQTLVGCESGIQTKQTMSHLAVIRGRVHGSTSDTYADWS